jgi:protein-disulfide isomerase
MKYVTFIYNDMVRAKINATPTIFVNGKELDRATQYYDPAAFTKALSL